MLFWTLMALSCGTVPWALWVNRPPSADSRRFADDVLFRARLGINADEFRRQVDEIDWDDGGPPVRQFAGGIVLRVDPDSE